MKATFSVAIIIPAHLTAISNMPELSVIHLPSSTTAAAATAKSIALKKVVFDTSPKMSTYLLAWAIGEFDFVQGSTKSGVTIRVITPPGRGLQGKFALDVGIRSLEFYDDFFKVSACLPVCVWVCMGVWQRMCCDVCTHAIDDGNDDNDDDDYCCE